jgi:hypothetical protein
MEVLRFTMMICLVVFAAYSQYHAEQLIKNDHGRTPEGAATMSPMPPMQAIKVFYPAVGVNEQTQFSAQGIDKPLSPLACPDTSDTSSAPHN